MRGGPPSDGPGWSLRLQGPPELHRADGLHLPLVGKLAGALAYLALEGPTSRADLAGLLWPDVEPEHGRNSLVQALRRLRQWTGEELVTGRAVLQLRADLPVDVAQADAAHARGRLEDAHALLERGELLAHVELDDCPTYAEWLRLAREARLELRGAVWSQLSRLAEDKGRLTEALQWQERLVSLDPLDERACQRVMDLHLRQGNRHLALGAYDRYRALLHAELNAEPPRELTRMAQDIRDMAPQVTPSAASLPLTLLRPPVLVGRDPEWQQLLQAWHRGQILFLHGQPGVGKTRLALDFAWSQGEAIVVTGQVGDRGIPFSTLSRAFRTSLAASPQLHVPEWIRYELSRLFPEFRVGAAAPPLRGDDDRLRFYAAAYALQELLFAPGQCLVCDDLHLADEATLAYWAYMLAQLTPADGRGSLRVICTCRTAELQLEQRAFVQPFLDSGISVALEVKPLTALAVEELLQTLELPQVPSTAPALMETTGGNPLLVVETLRYLLRDDQSRLSPDALVGVPRIRDLLRAQVRQLSAPTQQVAQAAATLRHHFWPELVADILGTPLLGVLTAWEELEQAEVIEQDHFRHALLHETIYQDLPLPVRRLLHRRAARVLAQERGESGEAAALLAHHWKAGDEPLRAAPLYLQAAQNFTQLGRFREAARHYLDAAQQFESGGNLRAAFDARASIFERLWLHELTDTLADSAAWLRGKAVTVEQQLRAILALAVTALIADLDPARVLALCREALEITRAHRDEVPGTLELEVRRMVVEASTLTGDWSAVALQERAAQPLLPTLRGTYHEALFQFSVGRARLRLLADATQAQALALVADALALHGDVFGADQARRLSELARSLA